MKLSENEKGKKCNKIMNAIKRSAIAENLVKNQSCAKNSNLERFKIIKSCCNFMTRLKLVLFVF